MNKHRKSFYQDLIIIIFSFCLAVFLVRTDALIRILTSSSQWEQFGSFIAGLFFTSIFTAAPSIVTLGEIAEVHPVLFTAFYGGLGAVIGDMIIFRFVKDRLTDDLVYLVKHNSRGRRLKELFRLKYFRWLTLLVGGLIIASPLPDELGIALLGFSKMKTSLFILLSFAFNFIGIYILGSIARSLST